MLPSPRGDRLFLELELLILLESGSYRPLAGIGCFNEKPINYAEVLVTVPSRG